MLCTEPSVHPAGLRALVDAVDAALHHGDSPPPAGGALLRVIADPTDDAVGPDDGGGGPAGGAGGGELGVLPLGGGHPLDALLGLVAPPTWSALGVAGPGDARALDGDCSPERVHITMLLARSGASASVLRHDGRPPRRLDEPPQGPVADACRRALGLPTAPAPHRGTAELWTRWWLDRLVQLATEDGMTSPTPGWAEAVALHPATFVPLPVGADPSDEPALGQPPLSLAAPAPEPAALAAAAQALADAWSWGRLRANPHIASLPAPSISRAVIEWMDDGMFARWVLSRLPPAGDLLDACRALLPEGVAARVTEVTAAALGEPGEER